MNRLFGTTMVIDEAAMTSKRRSFAAKSITFFVVFMIGSFISGLLLSIPSYIYVLQSDAFKSFAENAESTEAIAAELENILNNLPWWLTVLQLISNIGAVFAAVYYCTKSERRRFFTLGFIKKDAFKEYAAGLGVGLVMISVAYGIIIASGEARIEGVWVNTSAFAILCFFVGYTVQAMSEEVMLRGYYMVSVAANGNVALAVFASSVLFSFLHAGNYGVNTLGLLNIFLFGIFAALYFIRRGSIWGVAAMHAMWNFAQGNIFGCNVSGNGSVCSVMNTVNTEKGELFCGGEFGPEGGLGVTVVIALGIGMLLLMKNKTVLPEINFKKEFQSA